MLWYTGLIFLVAWVIEKFLLHKGGFIHTLLLIAIGLFVAQFVQDRRTKQYERDQGRS